VGKSGKKGVKVVVGGAETSQVGGACVRAFKGGDMSDWWWLSGGGGVDCTLGARS
jgi:hypothetical protein